MLIFTSRVVGSMANSWQLYHFPVFSDNVYFADSAQHGNYALLKSTGMKWNNTNHFTIKICRMLCTMTTVMN